MTGEENSQETEETLSRKFTQQPSNTYIVDGTNTPIMAARAKMLNPVEVEVKYVTPFEPATGYNQMPVNISDPTTPTTKAAVSVIGGTPTFGTGALQVNALTILGDEAGGFSYAKTPIVYKTLGLTTAAGDTALWDPAAGKKFRLMGYTIDIAAGTTAAASCVIQLRDNATVIFTHSVNGGALAASAGRVIASVQLNGNGYISIASDNILNLNLSSALAVGGVCVNAWGTEI